ncbi:MAG: hypothetical protein H6933_05020 [Burkholderiaceae bacterium]|nr:hypothetical protein [Burkholderiaceae bacterium]
MKRAPGPPLRGVPAGRSVTTTVVAAAASALLAACAGVTAPPVATAPVQDTAPPAPAPAASTPRPAGAASAPAAPLPPTGDPLARLLAFDAGTRNLTAAELAREQARLATEGSAQATLQLAWLLAQGQAPGRLPGDLARAQALLDPVARGDRPEAPLARLLLVRLAEQRRLDEQLERQAQQQRELQRRNEQLREQLEALRAIERSLGPRPPASAPRTP